MFIIAIAGLCAWLVWLIIQFRRDIGMLQSTIGTFTDDTGNLLTLHRAEIRTAFTTQSQELSSTVTRLGTILESHYTRTNEQIASINGQELSKAVLQFASLVEKQRAAAGRIEQAAIAFGTLARHMLSEGALRDADSSVTTDIDDKGYASNPSGERWSGTSSVAAGDTEALDEESADNTTGEGVDI